MFLESFNRYSGAVAKRLCRGLQILVGRFDSAPRLQHQACSRRGPVPEVIKTHGASGEIGIHKGLKIPRRKPCRFKSGLAHHLACNRHKPAYP